MPNESKLPDWIPNHALLIDLEPKGSRNMSSYQDVQVIKGGPERIIKVEGRAVISHVTTNADGNTYITVLMLDEMHRIESELEPNRNEGSSGVDSSPT